MGVPIGPEELGQGGKVLEDLFQAGKWLAGTVAAAWLAFKWTAKAGVKAGEEKQKYQDLVMDMAAIKAEKSQWITKTQHDDMQKLCQGEIERMIDLRLHRAVMEWRDELAALNANICHIMGALNIRPVDQGKRRRRSDAETGD